MNVIYEFDTTNIFLIILLSILFIFFSCLLLGMVYSFFKSKSALSIILILFFAFGAGCLLKLDANCITLAHKMQNQQYNKLHGTISIVSIEKSYSKYKKDPDYLCTLKVGDEIISNVGYFDQDVIDKLNENPNVELCYINMSGKNTVCKIIEMNTEGNTGDGSVY